MALPDLEAAKTWVGKDVVDPAGTSLGRCTRVYADLDTGAPEWLRLAREDGGERVVPLIDAADTDGRIQVTFAEALVAGAPVPSGLDELSPEEEAALYGHYGVEVSESASDSLLPAGHEPGEADSLSERVAEASPPEVEPAPVEPSTEAQAQPVRAADQATAVPHDHSDPVPASTVPAPAPAYEAPAEQPGRSPLAYVLGAAAAVLAVLLGRRFASSGRPVGRAAARPVLLAAGGASRAVRATGRVGSRLTARSAGIAARAVAGLPRTRAPRVRRSARPRAKAIASAERLKRTQRSAGRRASGGLGLTIGYLLGARAGRARYEQIKQAASSAAARPEVTRVGGRLVEAANNRLAAAPARVQRLASSAGAPWTAPGGPPTNGFGGS